MENEKKEIKLRRALILGNFYNQKVRIIQHINGIQQEIVDVIIGVQPSQVLMKSGDTIDRDSIKSIYPL